MVYTKKNDFIEIKFTGYTNGQIFDSNIEEDLKTINPKAEPKKLIVSIGHGMVVRGLDLQLVNKEINREYKINVEAKDAFGQRKRELLKTIPLTHFHAQKIDPQPGMILGLDNQPVKVIAISGARVTVDLNNILAGKDLNYKLIITRIITDDKEKTEAVLKMFLNFIPDYEIKNLDLIIRGEKSLEFIANAFKEKFKEILGKNLKFELKVSKKEKKETIPKERS